MMMMTTVIIMMMIIMITYVDWGHRESGERGAKR